MSGGWSRKERHGYHSASRPPAVRGRHRRHSLTFQGGLALTPLAPCDMHTTPAQLRLVVCDMHTTRETFPSHPKNFRLKRPEIASALCVEKGTPKLDTSHLHLVATVSGPNPSQNRASEILFKNPSSGSNIKNEFKNKSGFVSWRFQFKTQCSGSGSHRFAVNNSPGSVSNL